jgi:hypothetical protein
MPNSKIPPDILNSQQDVPAEEQEGNADKSMLYVCTGLAGI